MNLQKTPLDGLASLVIHAKCEEVSTLLMSRLGLEIPGFLLRRRVDISSSTTARAGESLFSVAGMDMDGLPFTFFKEVYYYRAKISIVTFN